MSPSRLATLLLLGSMITFNAPCGRLDLGNGRAHAAEEPSPATSARDILRVLAYSPLSLFGRLGPG
jgi:hypothetical protein